MSWLYVPELEESNWGSSSQVESVDSLLARSVWWRGKSMQPQYWRKKWKRETWMPVLFGPTLRHSQKSLTSLVEKWISSLEDTRVSPSPKQGKEGESKTQDTFSQIYAELSRQSSLPFASSRTSQDTSAWDSQRFTKAYEVWVTQLRQDSLQRQKLARLTKGKDSLSWPTAQETDTRSGRTLVTTRTGRIARRKSNAGDRGVNLSDLAENWATPTSRDHKDGNCQDANVPTNSLLGHQAPRTLLGQESSSDGQNLRQQWQTMTVLDSQGRDYTYPSGNHEKPFLTLTGQAKSKGKKLNSLFVEWLMNVPLTWTQLTGLTDYEHWEMQSSQVVQQWLLLNYGEKWLDRWA